MSRTAWIGGSRTVSAGKVCHSVRRWFDVRGERSKLRVVRRIFRGITVLLLVLTLGLHWAVLQTVAWTGMLVAYSAEVGLREGVSRTFDGQHPCPLCKAIQKGRAEEKQQSQHTPKASGKLDPAETWTPLELDFWQPAQPPPSDFPVWLERREPPARPRPRLNFA